MNLDAHACYLAVRARDARHDGRFFTCVKTTGIYCRPVCPARAPRRENCEFVVSAAAAQAAGYRPCLRCRPESAPSTGAWRGSSASVRRALSLIEAGALDASSVETLAARLGLGGRQLRRLFVQHMGATPVSVAQTRRMLLACQLLSQTQLSMTEVALASGYGSIRRFNESFRVLYGRPPGALRRERGAQGAAVRGAPVRLLLSYRPPYDWPAMLGFLERRAITGMERVVDGAYQRTFRLGQSTGRLRVEHVPGQHALAVSVWLSSLADLPYVVDRVRRVFDLAADPEAIGQALSQDPRLAGLVAARPGLRVPGVWDGFEAAARAVLGQQVSVTAAVALLGKLVEAFGESPRGASEDGPSRLFPRPEALHEPGVRALGMPGARARALCGVAASLREDPALFDPHADLPTALVALKSLPGIGDWTAHYIALRGMGESDAFPAADAGLLRTWASLTGTRPSSRALAARAARWTPWRGYAAQHLWTADTQDGVSALPKAPRARKVRHATSP